MRKYSYIIVTVRVVLVKKHECEPCQ